MIAQRAVRTRTAIRQSEKRRVGRFAAGTAGAGTVSRSRLEFTAGDSIALKRILLARSDKSHSGADQQDAGPANRADIFAQDVFRAQCAYNVVKCRGGDHKTDRLPGKKDQKRIKRKREQRNTGPKPT